MECRICGNAWPETHLEEAHARLHAMHQTISDMILLEKKVEAAEELLRYQQFQIKIAIVGIATLIAAFTFQLFR